MICSALCGTFPPPRRGILAKETKTLLSVNSIEYPLKLCNIAPNRAMIVLWGEADRVIIPKIRIFKIGGHYEHENYDRKEI